MIANNNTWAVQIPSSLKDGDYVLRTELIALHQAGTVEGAQNYPQCVNLRVTGGGNQALSGGQPATSLYKPSDPGIVFHIAAQLSRYPVPGPPVKKL